MRGHEEMTLYFAIRRDRAWWAAHALAKLQRRGKSGRGGKKVRWKGKLKLGWFPLPLAEAERIRKFLVFPAASSAAVDPCIGEGRAFAATTAGATGYRYGMIRA